MSYHSIGQLDLSLATSPTRRVIGPANVTRGGRSADTMPSPSLFQQQLVWWETIRGQMRRFLLMLEEVISKNRHLSRAEKTKLRAERTRLQGLISTVGRPSGSWTSAQLAALSRAKSEGGVPATMGLIEKSRYTNLISAAKRMRSSWDRLASTLPAQAYSPTVARGQATTLSPSISRFFTSVPGGSPGREEVITEEQPPLVEEPLDPTVTAPHDAREPAPQEPDYYVDPYAPPPMPSEPSAEESLLPEAPRRRIPWWAWALGLAAVGGGIYFVVKD